MPPRTASVVAAFAVVASWAVAADHARDGDRRLAGFVRRLLDPFLDRALAALRVQPGHPPDPRELPRIEPMESASLDDLLANYRPYVAGLWTAAFSAAGCHRLSGPLGIAVAERLGRVMLLTDLWVDRDEDRVAGRPNPLANDPRLADEVALEIRADLQDLVVLTAGAPSPHREALANTFALGVPARIARLSIDQRGSA